MNKWQKLIWLVPIAILAIAAVPSFTDFNAAHFSTAGNVVSIIYAPLAGTATNAVTIPLDVQRSFVAVFDDLMGAYGGGTIGSGPGGLNFKANSGAAAQENGISLTPPGIVRMHTSTSASSYPIFGQAADLAVKPFYLTVADGWITNEWRIYLPDLATASENYTNIVGFVDTTGDAPANGAYFQYDTNDVHFKCISIKDGTRTVVTNTTTVTEDTWFKLKIVLTYTNAIFTVDGSDVVQITANLPDSEYVGPSVIIAKGGGTTPRYCFLDYFYLAYRLATTR